MSGEDRRRAGAEIVRTFVQIAAEPRSEFETGRNLEPINDMGNDARQNRRSAGHTGVAADDERRRRSPLGLLAVMAEISAISENTDPRPAMSAMNSEAERADDHRERVERNGEPFERERSEHLGHRGELCIQRKWSQEKLAVI
ncbi:hypothetical protein [Methylosinus sp. 3S-1]|uniref:hypothetical protein n=1 Tax=Methylosinus sp. 3S-1 TaxID=1849840 RepID=UPI0012EA461E|nr:hypothetical protein [Methylosinus sp. 3S-1]